MQQDKPISEYHLFTNLQSASGALHLKGTEKVEFGEKLCKRVNIHQFLKWWSNLNDQTRTPIELLVTGNVLNCFDKFQDNQHISAVCWPLYIRLLHVSSYSL